MFRSELVVQLSIYFMKYYSHLGCLLLSSLTLHPLSCATNTKERGIIESSESFMSGGKKIQVETFAPVTVGRFPTVLVLHSSAGTILGKGSLVMLCRKLAAEGKMAMLVHYYDRTNTHWSDDEKIRKLWPTWAQTIKDAVSYAASDPRSKPEAIGLFGYSLGAYLAVAVASEDARVSAVVEVAGGIFVNPSPNMKRMPSMLILHGRQDQRVSVTQAYELERAARKLGARPKLHIYEGEGHVLSREAMQDAIARTLKFFAANLSAN